MIFVDTILSDPHMDPVGPKQDVSSNRWLRTDRRRLRKVLPLENHDWLQAWSCWAAPAVKYEIQKIKH